MMPHIPQQWRIPGVSLEIHQDYEEIVHDRPTPDPHWRFTDPLGHEHYWQDGYPTLSQQITKSHWCNGSEGFMPHDPHHHIDEFIYVCLKCMVVVEPRMRPAGAIDMIPKPLRGTIRAFRVGCLISAHLTHEECKRITRDRTAEAIQAVIDDLPEDRIFEREFRSL